MDSVIVPTRAQLEELKDPVRDRYHGEYLWLLRVNNNFMTHNHKSSSIRNIFKHKNQIV